MIISFHALHKYKNIVYEACMDYFEWRGNNICTAQHNHYAIKFIGKINLFLMSVLPCLTMILGGTNPQSIASHPLLFLMMKMHKIIAFSSNNYQLGSSSKVQEGTLCTHRIPFPLLIFGQCSVLCNIRGDKLNCVK